jgi:flagellar basal-body rod protein FlgF
MSDSFTAAYSALEARMKMVDVIANNLANANTTGFKRDFGRILESEQGFDVGTAVDLSAGDLIATKNDLDVAISGAGFFAVQTPQGVRYTRAGTFSLNDKGDLVTKDGMPVLSTSDSPINIGEGDIFIQDNGAVTVDGNEIATLKIVNFKKTDMLQKEGLHRFVWNGDAKDIETVPEPKVKSGHLEHSNVNAVDEMVHLMAAYRDFESVQRTVKTLMTDMNTRLIQELGKLS